MIGRCGVSGRTRNDIRQRLQELGVSLVEVPKIRCMDPEHAEWPRPRSRNDNRDAAANTMVMQKRGPVESRFGQQVSNDDELIHQESESSLRSLFDPYDGMSYLGVRPPNAGTQDELISRIGKLQYFRKKNVEHLRRDCNGAIQHLRQIAFAERKGSESRDCLLLGKPAL